MGQLVLARPQEPITVADIETALTVIETAIHSPVLQRELRLMPEHITQLQRFSLALDGIMLI